MRLFVIFIFVGLAACSKSEKTNQQIFIPNQKELTYNYRPYTKVVEFDFEAVLEESKYFIWETMAKFSLENNGTLSFGFIDNEINEDQIISSSYWDSDPVLDTLLFNENEFRGRSGNTYYCKTEIDFGQLFFKFDFSKTKNSIAENQKLFENYLSKIDIADFVQPDFYQFEKLDSQILISQGAINSKFSGFEKIDNHSRYLLESDLLQSPIERKELYRDVYGLLFLYIEFFQNGDEILVSKNAEFPLNGKLKKEEILMHLVYRKIIREEEGDGSWMRGQKNFDCIYFAEF